MDSELLILLLPAICIAWAAIFAMAALRDRNSGVPLALFLVLGAFFCLRAVLGNEDLSVWQHRVTMSVMSALGWSLAPLIILQLQKLCHGTGRIATYLVMLILPVVLLLGGLLLPDRVFPLRTIYLSGMTASFLALLVYVFVKCRKTPSAVILGCLLLVTIAIIPVQNPWFPALQFLLLLFAGSVLFDTLVAIEPAALPAATATGTTEEAKVNEPSGEKETYARNDVQETTAGDGSALLADGFGALATEGISSNAGTDGETAADGTEDGGGTYGEDGTAMATSAHGSAPSIVIRSAGLPTGTMTPSFWDELLSRFQTLMVDEQLFLRPRLTIEEVAKMLNTNKTYVSRMVNENYNTTFPEVVNNLRVDYAEQYLLDHRHARQEEIALACGFVSASSFNTIFKKITGMPPRQWVTDWDARHNRGPAGADPHH